MAEVLGEHVAGSAAGSAASQGQLGLDDVLAADGWARARAGEIVGRTA